MDTMAPPDPSQSAGSSPLSSLPPSPLLDLPRARCEPDPLDPDANLCLAKVTTDDRQGISHFFGRNKKATQSIPEDLFPLLCRTHYQEKQYRWRATPTQLAAFQCDCILKTLSRMSTVTWTDDKGLIWPYWCGFEVRTQRPGTVKTGKMEKAGAKTRTASQAAGATADSQAEEFSGGVPPWLLPLVTRREIDDPFAPVGDRDGVRYSFSQLEAIVNSIKSYCLLTGSKLPAIEALPITIGMVDEAELDAAKKVLKEAQREHNLALGDLQRHLANKTGKNEARKTAFEKVLAQKKKAMDAAQLVVTKCERGVAVSKETVPKKRSQKKRKRAKNETSVEADLSPIVPKVESDDENGFAEKKIEDYDMVDEDQDDEDGDDVDDGQDEDYQDEGRPSFGLKRKGSKVISLKYGRGNKRVKRHG